MLSLKNIEMEPDVPSSKQSNNEWQRMGGASARNQYATLKVHQLQNANADQSRLHGLHIASMAQEQAARKRSENSSALRTD